MSSVKCVYCSKYLISGTFPRQASCGDRLCGDCYQTLIRCCLLLYCSRKEQQLVCPSCRERFLLSECFRDKAVELELAVQVLHCSNSGCTWKGKSIDFQTHLSKCDFALVKCHNRGCDTVTQRYQLKKHWQVCPLEKVACKYCHKTLTRNRLRNHMAAECPEVDVLCTNECGNKCQRAVMEQHLNEECPKQVRSCRFPGCSFKGVHMEMDEHNNRNIRQHLDCVLDEMNKLSTGESTSLKTEVASIKSLVESLQPAVTQLQDGHKELALLVQTLQATSYDGTFVWKIPEIKRRRSEAQSGKTVSLYSAPFYTSRHGYKMCLRLYLDGDGTGKGTHLSFFLTLMKGEYDALLPWPFRQMISLVLLDQDRQKNIVQSFQPDPSSSSFQRPVNEMSVASGCPTFTPLSILDNPSYVKDDTMFLQCRVNCSGLEKI